jgi:hypothetical protein
VTCSACPFRGSPQRHAVEQNSGHTPQPNRSQDRTEKAPMSRAIVMW